MILFRYNKSFQVTKKEPTEVFVLTLHWPWSHRPQVLLSTKMIIWEYIISKSKDTNSTIIRNIQIGNLKNFSEKNITNLYVLGPYLKFNHYVLNTYKNCILWEDINTTWVWIILETIYSHLFLLCTINQWKTICTNQLIKIKRFLTLYNNEDLISL